MERVISQDERIRRAEEIYERRQMQRGTRRSATVNLDNNNGEKLTRKLIIQCIVCLLIYGAFYTIKNIPNFVSQEAMYKLSDILEYDINIQKLYEDFNTYINKTEDASIENNEFVEETLSASENTDDENTNETTEQTEEPENTEKAQTPEESQPQETEPQDTEAQETKQEAEQPAAELSQMEIDAQYIKANFSLIKPLEGEITSRFGPRNPTVPTVPKNHTGIDIARVEGTVIISAMNGTVEQVSSEGDLRKSCKNNRWRCFNCICTL